MHVETIAADAATEARARVTIAARPLAEAVKLLSAKLISRRETIPHLCAVLIEVSPCGLVTLTGTDLETWGALELRADASEAIEPGRLCINAKALSDALAKARKASDRVRLTGEPGPDHRPYRVRLKASRSEFMLAALDPEEFPAAPIAAYCPDMAGTVDRAQFLSDLAAMAPAMHAEETRYYLHGVALQVRQLAGRDRFVMAATDGFMMAAASRPIPAGCEAWADAIMPRDAITFALAADKLAGKGGMTLSRSGEFLALEFGAVRMICKPVDGTYADWPRAFEAMAAPTDGEGQGALFPDLLPEWPLARTEALQKAAAGAIDWRGGMGGVVGECATDPDMMWAATWRAFNLHGAAYDEGVTVEVEGDREYRIATKGAKIELTKEQVAALCGDDLWNVLEFPSADGRPRYVSQWLWDDGASRFLCVGADGRCPPAGAPREYVTRAEVEAALAGEPVSARQMPEDCAEAAPMPADAPQAPASAPEPLSCQPAADAPPIAAERVKRSDAERRAILRAWQMRAAMRRMRAEAEAEAVPAEVMADIAEAERLIRCADYMPPIAIQADATPTSGQAKRTPAHERAIRRAWAMRKARREELSARLELHRQRDEAENRAALASIAADKAESRIDELERAMLNACNGSRDLAGALQRTQTQLAAAQDQARLAESIAEDHLRMREDMQSLLRDAEARLAAAEAENAQLWAEIETLTAPEPALAA